MKFQSPKSCQIKNLDQLYNRFFSETKHGFFIDVGAGDGISWSNTRALALIGWSGIMIEPLEERFKKCVLEYANNPQVIIEQYCIGDFTGHTKLYLASNPTIDIETVQRSPWGYEYDPEEFILSPVKTLDAVCIEQKVPENFEVLSIDVEGADHTVLIGFNLLPILKPKMIIIETHDGSKMIERDFHVYKINVIMVQYPYKLFQRDGLNSIFILDEFLQKHGGEDG